MSHKFGPTGKFPMGKIDPTDEGELTIGVAADSANGTVILTFGKPTAWVGFYPAQARAMAAALLKHAETLEKGAQ